MNKYKFFDQSKSFIETMTPDEIFHLGVTFAQERIIKWLQTSTDKDWFSWLEAKIDAEDQEV